MINHSLVAPQDTFLLLSVLALVAWFGVIGDRRGWFKRVSGVLISIFITGLLSSLNIIPSASDNTISVPAYTFIFNYFVYLAIPLLLLDTNLKTIIRQSGRMLWIFLIGTVGVMIGGIIAAKVSGLPHEDSWKLGGILTGTYIGGSMNFIALATAYGFTTNPLFPSAVVADNILTNVYVFILLLLPGIKWIKKQYPVYREKGIAEAETKELAGNGISLTEKLLFIIFLSASIVAVSKGLSSLVRLAVKTDLNFDIVFITLISVSIANIFPGQLKKFAVEAFNIGMFLLYMFLAVVGANADISQVFSASPQVFLMVGIIMIVHLLLVLIAGKLFKFSLEEICLSSCANISGPPVCVPLAEAYKTKNLLVPVVLVAIFSYAIGNIIGFGMGWILR